MPIRPKSIVINVQYEPKNRTGGPTDYILRDITPSLRENENFLIAQIVNFGLIIRICSSPTWWLNPWNDGTDIGFKIRIIRIITIR